MAVLVALTPLAMLGLLLLLGRIEEVLQARPPPPPSDQPLLPGHQPRRRGVVSVRHVRPTARCRAGLHRPLARMSPPCRSPAAVQGNALKTGRMPASAQGEGERGSFCAAQAEQGDVIVDGFGADEFVHHCGAHLFRFAGGHGLSE
jgi:hypothetical protein